MDPAVGGGGVTALVSTLPEAKLDLSEHFVLQLHAAGIAMVDQRPPHECACAPCWAWQPSGGAPTVALYALMQARARRPDGEWHAPIEVTPEQVHQAYGNRVLQARAKFPDGLEEDWTIRADPLQVGFDWIRQPYTAGSQCAFLIQHPAPIEGLHFWHGDSGMQSLRCRDGAVHAGEISAEGKAPAASAIMYSDIPRAAMRVQTVPPGLLSVSVEQHGPEGAAAKPGASWLVEWQVPHGQLIHLTGNLGMQAAARKFMSPALGAFADASTDFGAYYMQVLLGGLGMLDVPQGLPRPAALCHAQDAVSLDELALASECLGLCAPQWLAQQLRRALEQCLELPTALPMSGALGLLPECRDGLVLLMAGRYLRLTGDVEFITSHAPALRELAEHLLTLRRPGEALPCFTMPDGRQAKEPASVAVVSAGLSRWAAIEERLGESTQSTRYGEAAMAMQWAAMAPIQTGGLWHLGRGTFVNYRLAIDDTQEDPENLPGSELDFGQQLIAFWLGLCPDEELIRRSFEWVDYSYTYATGRGGPAYPPGYTRGFHALVDVVVRARHGCGDIASILQRTLDVGARGGMPFSATLRGEPMPAGMLLDNAPYFEVVLHQHYGLDYDAGGWRLFTPRPLPNYPLTRVTGLRHRNALYAITWQGRGAIQRVTINGAPHATRVLDKVTGEHEVVVTLA